MKALSSIGRAIGFIFECLTGILEFIGGLLLGLGVTYLIASVFINVPILYWAVWIVGVPASIIAALFPE